MLRYLFPVVLAVLVLWAVLDLCTKVSRQEPAGGGEEAAEAWETGPSPPILGLPRDIEGEDIDGVPFRLSDYRGQVVAVVFWGTWCPACRAMWPHERALVKRLQGKPFVLLGVNSDPERARLKELMRVHDITWRSWWDGGTGSGPIARKWGVEYWPAVYVFDHKGFIRGKGLRDHDLDVVVNTLVAELEKEKTPAGNK
jgi:thiol-disulfide isomerase/thioredoxin